MKHGSIVVSLLSFLVQAHANGIEAGQNSMDTMTNEPVNGFVHRASQKSGLFHTDMENTTFGKVPVMPKKATSCIRYGCSVPHPGGPALDQMLRKIATYAAVGDKFPAVEIDFGFPPTKVDMAERLANKKTIVVGMPGAFTGT